MRLLFGKESFSFSTLTLCSASYGMSPLPGGSEHHRAGPDLVSWLAKVSQWLKFQPWSAGWPKFLREPESAETNMAASTKKWGIMSWVHGSPGEAITQHSSYSWHLGSGEDIWNIPHQFPMPSSLPFTISLTSSWCCPFPLSLALPTQLFPGARTPSFPTNDPTVWPDDF